MSGRLVRGWIRLAALRRDQRGSSAVEFAMVCAPFVITLMAILQMGLYFMTQAALDSGVNAEADALNTTFYSQNIPTAPTAATLQSQIAAKAGGLINTATLLVDLQPFSGLTSTAYPIGTYAPPAIGPTIGTKGTCSSQSSCGGSVLALRAQAPVISFAPGFGSLLVVRSAVLVRRQGQ